MSDEIFNEIIEIRKLILDSFFIYTRYDKLNSEFISNHIKKLVPTITSCEDFKYLDPSILTKEQLKNLDFEENIGFEQKYSIYLIPLWLYPFLSEKLNIVDLNKNKINNKSDIKVNEKDTAYLRYGVLKEN